MELIYAFLGGLLSFLSPCVLPLAPPYLAFIAGTTIDQLSGEEADKKLERRVLLSAIFFVLGLATVFVALGATASGVGQALARYKYEFGIVAGFVIYGLGQHFIGFKRAILTAAVVFACLLALWALGEDGLIWSLEEFWPILAGVAVLAVALQFSGYDNIPFLMYEARFEAGSSAGGLAGAYVIGLAFAFGWTPCIGPILGSVLLLAAQEETLWTGVGLLAVYAAGLGLPFIIAALFVRSFMGWMRRFRRHMGTVEICMGGLLIAVGALMMTGAFESLAFWLLETFPILGTIG